ncbi:hypothetical protein GCM10007989_04950 [Devosia pacifica]|uniref:IraD/Gp25-like domain-containing protein n=1 Tax=Devosia pacifica TaxID=1335967 RepID=A0A918RUM5_9HYPH|nr:GPW/gp25 family protein [Devosia pacifica]GHA13360.1 hypothetical protein GCM10007989_04950 [Devosia pacifica]
MADIDRHTGAVIDNFSSALQSVELIFSTRLGEVVLARDFGAGLVELLGRALTPKLIAAFQTLMVVGIDLWEPRFRVRRVSVDGSVDEIRLGRAGFRIEVDWRPRGHLGDFRVEGVRAFGVNFGNGQARVLA